MRISILTCLSALFICGQSLAATEIPELAGAPPGLERGEWTVEPWGNPGAVERIESHNRKLLKFMFVPAGKEKTAFKHATGLGVAEKGKVTVHVYSEKILAVSLAISTTAAFTWYESKPAELKAGWNTLEFEAGAPAWKTAAAEWKFMQPVEAPGDVRAIDLIVQNKHTAGEIYVAGFTYDADETGKRAEKLAQDLGSDDADKRAKAEQAILDIGKPAIEVLSQAAASGDKPEIRMRALLLLKALETPDRAEAAAPGAPNPFSAEIGEDQLERARQYSGARVQVHGPAVAPAPHAPAPADLNAILADAQQQLQTLRTELNRINDQTAALIKTVEEANAFIKKIDEEHKAKAKSDDKGTEKAPSKEK
jgi:hypothetical protein